MTKGWKPMLCFLVLQRVAENMLFKAPNIIPTLGIGHDEKKDPYLMRQEKMCIRLLFLDCLSCFHHTANQNVLLTHFANCKQGQRAFVGNNENVEGSELVYYSVYH